ncbi:unnamed protein product, partial [Iphiclides podalirius]
MFSNILLNAETAEKRLADIKTKVEELKKIKVEEKIQELVKENSSLVKKIEVAKSELISLETSNGKKQYPLPDSLYVEKIDCGEQTPRTVVSGLVNYVPIDEMRDKFVMVLCNLKPVKMRGIISEAMVMCASSPDKVEVLIPPPAVLPGDLVHCEGYPREPEVQLNPKKKIFETCAPYLKTNDDKVACYKDSPLFVPEKGVIVAPSLKGVNVK